MPRTKLTLKKNKKTATSETSISQQNTSSFKKLIKVTKKKILPILQTSVKNSNSSNSSNSIRSLDKYIPPVNKNKVYPKYWELPNRKHFYNWVSETFKKYEETNTTSKSKTELARIPEQIELSNIQRLTRDYLQGEGPVRGLLLYIGLGVGKTCAAIAISEAILTKKEVLVISKASLETNFRKGVKECGSDYLKNLNHWVFNECHTESEKELAKDLGIPTSVIRDNGGAFFIDFTINTANYNDLSHNKKEKLDNQINHMLDNRFKFLHSDSSVKAKYLVDGCFDNKIVIIDEVHNIGNTMNSKSPSGALFYKLFMNAKNPKYVFLSGTPIINQVYEVCKIFNILRGYMNVLEIKFKTLYDSGMNMSKYKDIKYMLLQKNAHIDQVIIDTTRKMIKVTKNPDDFITHPNGNGIIYKPDANISFSKFKDDIVKIIESMGYKLSIEEKKETCFPEDKEEFEKKFYNPEINKLKNIDLIKRRIAGLTSYFDYQDPKLFPELLPINIVQVPMSSYQFMSYEKYRHEEIKNDKFNKRKGENDEQMSSSSYRIKSRLACSFVFPEEIGSPYDTRTTNDKLIELEKLGANLDDFTLSAEDIDELTAKDYKSQINNAYFKILEKDKDKYLDIKNKSLAKYSPKYLEMVKNIQKQEKHGKIFVYSNFISLIGLNFFSFVLIQTGNWAPFCIKKEKTKNGIEWVLDEREEDKNKYKFMFYSGGVDKDTREIYRNIYNSDWDKLDTTCSRLVEQLKAIHKNNYYGEVIKMIMTTKTGAEGLDLKEVRFIHISEPYWQPVLITQIIGRGVRNKSHLRLAPKDRNVEVFVYMATITPDLVKLITHIDVKNDIYKYTNPALPEKAFKVVSSDEHLYMIAERKKYIVNIFQKLMKETAFDCTLNYSKNMLNPSNKGVICMDYNTKNRDEYIYTPGIDDTIETIDLTQEKIVVDFYDKILVKGKIYYSEKVPNSFGKIYIYNDTLPNKVRLPKPIGEFKIINGVRKMALYKKK